MKVLCEFSITTTDGDKGTISFPANLRLPGVDINAKKKDSSSLDVYFINDMKIKFN